MYRDPPGLVALKLALGQQLAAARKAVEMGQQRVGRKTGYSRSSVAKAETGHQLLTRDFWTTADTLLNADGALLASYEQVRAAKEEHEANSREAALATAYAEAKAQAQALRAASTLAKDQDGDGVAPPAGQEVLHTVIAQRELVDSFHQSDCLIRLGKPAQAAACAERGLRLYDSSFVSGVAYCTLRLGTAWLLSGEVEEAGRLTGEGAWLAIRSRSARLRNEVQAAQGCLRPWRDAPAVKQLDEGLSGLGFGGCGSV